MGGPALRPRTTIRPSQRRGGHRELRPLLPQRRTRSGVTAARQLPQRDLRPDGGMLEPRGDVSASIP